MSQTATDIEQRLRGENPEKCVVTDRLRANIGMPDTFQFDRDDAVELDELILEAADEIARLEADVASLRSKLEEAEGARGSALVATPPAGGDDWTVDDTLTAREILDYLGIGSDASLEPYADRRRDAVAKIIQKRVATTPPAEGVVEALLNNITDVVAEAEVDFPAGRYAGARVSFDEDAVRGFIRAALAAKDGRS